MNEKIPRSTKTQGPNTKTNGRTYTAGVAVKSTHLDHTSPR